MSSQAQRTTSGTINTNTQICQLTGTASIAGTTAITGVGTAFTTQLRIGSWVKINGEVRRIAGITNNTSAISDVAFSTTASTQTVFSSGRSQSRTGVYSVVAFNTNTDLIYLGESLNTAKDGTDITSSTGTVPIVAGSETSPKVAEDILNVFVQSPALSQKYSVTLNF